MNPLGLGEHLGRVVLGQEEMVDGGRHPVRTVISLETV